MDDVIPGALTRWRNVFIADITPPEEQKKEGHDRGDGPRITVASDAIAVPDVAHNQIQLSMLNGVTYEVGKDITDYHTTSGPTGDQILEATKPNEVHVKAYTELDTIPLYKVAYHDPKLDPDNVIQARIELHQRLALPPACFLLALIGIPLGVSSRKGGKSSAFVVTVALAFIYWMGLIGGQRTGQAAEASGRCRDVDPERRLRPGRHRSDHPPGTAGRPRLDRHGERMVPVRLASPAWNPAHVRRANPAAPAHLAAVLRAPSGGHATCCRAFLFYFALLLVELRADDARLHVLRAAERHREKPYRDVARVHVSVLPDAAVDLRLRAHQRAGGGADHLRNS